MFYGRKCPECAYQSPLAEVEETRTDLVEATGRPEPNGKRPNRRSDVWAELNHAKRSSDVRGAVEAIGRRRGYKPGWAGHILESMGVMMEDEQRVIDPYERRVIKLSFRDEMAQIEYYFYEFPNGTWGFVVGNSKVFTYESRAECVEDMTQNMKNFVLRQLNLPEED